jgi:hypothetical protein
MSAAMKRKKKSPTLREEDWKNVKPRVIELYSNFPLRKVREEIEKEFPGFKASLVLLASMFSSKYD